MLIVNRNRISKWESIELIELANEQIALKAYTGKYIGQQGKILIAHSPYIGYLETFQIITMENGKIALKIYDGKYICAEGGGGGILVANRNKISPWTTFELISVE